MPARRGRGRPPAALRGSLREHVLDCAWVEFGQRGFGAATVQGICKRAGLGLATFYRLFPDKSAIFAEAMQRVSRAISERTMRIDSALSFEDSLVAFGRMFLGFVTDERFSTAIWLLFSEGRNFPELREAFTTMSRPWLDLLAAVIRRHRPLLSADEAFECAQFYSEMVAGAISRERLISDSAPDAARVERTVLLATTIFVRGVGDTHAGR